MSANVYYDERVLLREFSYERVVLDGVIFLRLFYMVSSYLRGTGMDHPALRPGGRSEEWTKLGKHPVSLQANLELHGETLAMAMDSK